MPSFDLANALTAPLLFLTTIGTVVIGSVAIVYSLIFVGGRIKDSSRIRIRLGTAILASFLVIVLAALDIYLAVLS